ncbi:MAG: NYN domain-containing protein [Pirellulaceae bacterium]|nr:NYN domain-containing protein [Pirellulaceae bacterium]
MRLLIDGYNLLFQSQFLGRQRGPGWLHKARQRLLAGLHEQLPQDLLSHTTIVFDASRGNEVLRDFVSEHGVRVLFANEHPEADDLLEELIRSHTAPKSLQVVSSDHRIARCARARRAKIVTVDQFLDLLERKTRPHDSSSRGNSQPIEQPLSPDQVAYWLREFGQS